MSDPHHRAARPDQQAGLRRRAASRLTGSQPKGAAASEGPSKGPLDALAVLHRLALSPHTAPDALALLHELQVLQVELELQAQELQESRAMLESALRRQIELYDHQPAGCFTIDAQWLLQELNLTGAEQLGIAREHAFGLPLDVFFCAESAHRFRAAVSALGAGKVQACCALTLRPMGGAARPVWARVGVDPVAQRYLVNLVDAA